MTVDNKISLEEAAASIAADSAAAIAAAEEKYDFQVHEAARLILGRPGQNSIVLLAGPSGSGKTTTAHRIEKAIEGDRDICHYISMDNYFRSWSDPAFPRLADGSPNLDSPQCLDMPLLEAHFSALDEGRSIDLPVYDFGRHSRVPGKIIHIDNKPGDICIFEGIHALGPWFTARHPKAIRVFVSPKSSFTRNGEIICPPDLLRLMRRACRDALFRDAPLSYTLTLWENVAMSEKKWVLPYEGSAEICIDTVLSYELAPLREALWPAIEALPADAPLPQYVSAMRRALEAAAGIHIPREMIPDHSILREFIGG